MASLMAVLTLGGMSKRIRKYRAVARPGFWEAKKNRASLLLRLPLCYDKNKGQLIRLYKLVQEAEWYFKIVL